MEESVAISDATGNARTLDVLPLNAWRWGVVLWCGFVRFGCAALLLIAAALKGYQLFTDPSLGVVHGSRWLQTAIVEYELLLTIWLLSGIALHWGRRIALITFLGFGCYALFLGMSGKESCGCFGKIQVSPWLTFGIDSALILLLFVWKPQRVGGGSEPDSGFFRFAGRVCLVLTGASALIGVPALSLAARHSVSDSSIESALAHSRFVLLEPEKWIGKPFPLTDYIDIAEREHLTHGPWAVVFYRHDCPKCRQALPRYESLAEQLRSANEEIKIALIEVPPYGPAVLSANPPLHYGRLNESKEWLITTPAELMLMDGQVIAAELDAGKVGLGLLEDPVRLEAQSPQRPKGAPADEH